MSRVAPRGKGSLAAITARLRGEGLLPLAAFCEELDANPGAILRWVVEGRQTPDGRVYLDATVEAGGWYTSAEAVERFRAAIVGVRPAV